MKKSVIATSHYCVVITTIIVYALLASIFFEMDNNAYGERENFAVVDNDKTTITYSQQQQVEAECKSPCSDSAKMCIAMCA